MAREPEASDDPDAMRDALAGNLCRCTGYQQIVDAVVRARPRVARPRLSQEQSPHARHARDDDGPSARTAAQAVRLYHAAPHAVPIAGGTDLMVSWNLGAIDGRTVLDLSALDAWRTIVATKRAVRIGALATHAAIRDDDDIARHFSLLAASAATVGARQIQNRGTLGGNLANASPAGDTFPALSVYEATVLTRSTAGRRRLPLDDLFAGPKRTRLEPGELIEAVELVILRRPPGRVLFRKVGTRAAQAISKVVIAGLLWLTPDGRVDALRLAAGSVAPTVKRLRAVEAAMIGLVPSEDAIDRAVARLTDDVSPIDDDRVDPGLSAPRLRASRAGLPPSVARVTQGRRFPVIVRRAHSARAAAPRSRSRRCRVPRTPSTTRACRPWRPRPASPRRTRCWSGRAGR